jgi:hypothetical protein
MHPEGGEDSPPVLPSGAPPIRALSARSETIDPCHRLAVRIAVAGLYPVRTTRAPRPMAKEATSAERSTILSDQPSWAPLGAQVSLVLISLTALFTIGWRLAVARRYEAHRWADRRGLPERRRRPRLDDPFSCSSRRRSRRGSTRPPTQSPCARRRRSDRLLRSGCTSCGENELVPRAIAQALSKPFMRGAHAPTCFQYWWRDLTSSPTGT